MTQLNFTPNNQQQKPVSPKIIPVIKDYAVINLRTIGINFLKEKFSNIRPMQSEVPVGTSMFGLPIYGNLTIKGGEFVDLNTNEITYAEGIILNNVLMTVNQTKNIITTAMPGRNGTVKQFASNGDYLISVKGGISIGDTVINNGINNGSNNLIPDMYPTDAVATLFRLMNVRDTLEVESQFLNQFGIKSIIINDFSFDEQKGIRNMQIFEMNCLSDTKIVLQPTKI